MSQTQKLLDFKQKLKDEIAELQERRDTALKEAEGQEARNRSVIETIEKEGNVKKKFIQEEIEKHRAELKLEVERLIIVKRDLLDEIDVSNTKKSKIDDEIDVLIKTKDTLQVQINSNNEKLTEQDKQIILNQQELIDFRGKLDSVNAQIADRLDVKKRVEEDLQLLNDEADNIEDKIIDLDAQYKARKEYLDKQESDIQIRLKKASDSLVEAENKDKAMRKSWAEEHLKLDKRQEIVRKQELRLGDAEARVKELDDFMKL